MRRIRLADLARSQARFPSRMRAALFVTLNPYAMTDTYVLSQLKKPLRKVAKQIAMDLAQVEIGAFSQL